MAFYTDLPSSYRGGTLLQAATSRLGVLCDSDKVYASFVLVIIVALGSAFASGAPQGNSVSGIVIAAACTSSQTIVTESLAIPYDKTTVEDPNIEAGSTHIQTAGVNGIKTMSYEITTNAPDGCAEDTKQLIKEVVTTAPVTEVRSIGTHVTEAASSSQDSDYNIECFEGCAPPIDN